MDKNLAQQAIAHALSGDWKKAIAINSELVKANPNDTDALNRLARAYAESGDLASARKSAKKVLSLDPFNTIAAKALTKWKGLKKGETLVSGASKAEMFLEEPGKTKIVSLLHLGDAKLMSKLDAGDEVQIKVRGHKVCISSSNGKYIGRLPDDVSARVKKLIRFGNQYKAIIKSVDEKEVKVFLRETKRAEKLSDIPSFSSEKIDYISFTPPELVHKKEDIDMGVDEADED